MEKTLITGADGFIGSHLVEAAINAGVEVRALVHYNANNSWGWIDHLDRKLLKNVDVWAGDVRDAEFTRQLCSGCSSIFNLAALIAIPYSYVAPDSYIDTNVKGALNLLNAVRNSGVDLFVQMSTSEVYGSAQYVPIDESHPLVAQSPYAASKIAADQLAYSYFSAFDVPVAIARPFNTYGPRQSARAVIPTIITQIAEGASEIKLGDTSTTRDFNFVLDTVAGLLSFLPLRDKVVGETINIGSNFEVSIGSVAETIARVMNAEVEVVLDEKRLRPKTSEVSRLFSSNAKALSLLDWSPKYGGLDGFEAGLTKTIEWFLDSGNRQNYKSALYNL